MQRLEDIAGEMSRRGFGAMVSEYFERACGKLSDWSLAGHGQLGEDTVA
jgi:hypothetical protein